MTDDLGGKLYVGDVKRDGVPFRRWFVGRFVQSGDLRQTDALEVKFSRHAEWYRQDASTANRTATSLVVSVKGEFSLQFSLDGLAWRSEWLCDSGRYVMWGPR
jgi:hypothetical protein